jgi:plastocyanin
MRKLFILALVLGSLGVLASVAMAATKSVKVGDNYYVRPSGVPKVTVKKGTKVKWRFGTGTPHTVTVKSGPAKFNSGIKSSGTYSKRLKKRGTYVIYCAIHGAADQKMKLVVK